MSTSKENTLSDLNKHLFDALDRLNKPDMNDDQIHSEVMRASSVVGIGKTVVDNGRLVLEATKLQAEHKGSQVEMPPMLGGS